MAADEPSKGNAAIIAHPLFPALVALWFGAVFGLGSLAVSPQLLERIVHGSGLDLLLPAAAPPLGMTARILLSLSLAFLGGCLGAIIARIIARPRQAAPERRRDATAIRRRDAHPDAPARRPIFAHEELGGDTDAPFFAATPNRRRTLAMEENSGPEYGFESAPLPGGAPSIHDAGAAEDGGFVGEPEFLQLDQDSAETLDLSGFLGAGGDAAPESVSSLVIAEADFGDTGDASRPFAVPKPQFLAAPRSFASPEPAIHDRGPELAESPALDAPAERPFAAPVLTAIEDEESGQPLLPDATAAERIASADLGVLSHVELIERLALSLQRRRASAVAANAVAVAAARPIEELAPELATDDDAPSLPFPAPFAAPIAVLESEAASAPDPEHESLIVPPPLEMPRALRPIDFDDPEPDVDELVAALPPRYFPLPPAVEAQPEVGVAPEIAHSSEPVEQIEDEAVAEPESEDGETLEEGYSSLLALNRPAQPRQPSIRIDESEPGDAAIEPVVVFPGQAPNRDAPFVAPRFAAPAPAPMPPPTPTPIPEATPVTPAAGASPLRRFEPPSVAHAAPAPAPAQSAALPDPAETERALRAALASLQRMSGAA